MLESLFNKVVFLHQLVSCENTFFYRTPLVAAAVRFLFQPNAALKLGPHVCIIPIFKKMFSLIRIVVDFFGLKLKLDGVRFRYFFIKRLNSMQNNI